MNTCSDPKCPQEECQKAQGKTRAEFLQTRTAEQLREIKDAGDAALNELNRRYQEESAAIEKRMDAGTPAFKREELRFARDAKCPCGAKLAYPRGISPHGFWDCSAILMHTAIMNGQPGFIPHTQRLPFAFYEIKSEDQQS